MAAVPSCTQHNSAVLLLRRIGGRFFCGEIVLVGKEWITAGLCGLEALLRLFTIM